MKIDTTKIPNFDALPEEAREAILAMDFADAPDMTQFVSKSVFDKKASEAANLSKQLRERMSEDEVAQAKAAENLANIQAELEALRAEKTVSEYATQFMGIGYDEALAKSTATALQKGDMQTMFKNHAKFTADREKALKAELLKNTPTPPAGEGTKTTTKDDIKKMSLVERQKFATENPEVYKSIYGGD